MCGSNQGVTMKFEHKEDPPWVIILASVAVGASAAIVLFLALSGGL
jgi:hypothetical protein